MSRYFLTPLPQQVVAPPHRAKRDPLFSIAYTLFSIRNFPHLFCFLVTAHSLPKTPGVGVALLSNHTSAEAAILTPMHAISYKNIPSNPFGIYIFRKQPGWPHSPFHYPFHYSATSLPRPFPIRTLLPPCLPSVPPPLQKVCPPTADMLVSPCRFRIAAPRSSSRRTRSLPLGLPQSALPGATVWREPHRPLAAANSIGRKAARRENAGRVSLLRGIKRPAAPNVRQHQTSGNIRRQAAPTSGP
jgi:hypothetical protein